MQKHAASKLCNCSRLHESDLVPLDLGVSLQPARYSLHVTLLCEIHLLLLISLSLLFSSLQQCSCSCHQLLVRCSFGNAVEQVLVAASDFLCRLPLLVFLVRHGRCALEVRGVYRPLLPGVFGPPGVANAQRATLASAIVDNWIHKNVVRSRVRRVSSVSDGAPGN